MPATGVFPTAAGNFVMGGTTPLHLQLTAPPSTCSLFGPPYPIRRPTPVSLLLAFRRMNEDRFSEIASEKSSVASSVDDEVSELFRSFTDEEEFEFPSSTVEEGWEGDRDTSSVGTWRPSYSPSLGSVTGSDDSLSSMQMLDLHHETHLGSGLSVTDEDIIASEKAWIGYDLEADRLDSEVTCIAPQVIETGGTYGSGMNHEDALSAFISPEILEVKAEPQSDTEADASQLDLLTEHLELEASRSEPDATPVDVKEEAPKAPLTFRLPPGLVKRCAEHDTPRKM
ncbi:hypothetical protein HDV00_003461 [Rhizophlyctis rosea]|nr:hypothetical protein HDV00_003461 [Rhizophlyctis rosea]